jgi:putative ABC transport system permease protein
MHRLIRWLYGGALRLYPLSFRMRFGAAMQAAFDDGLEAARTRGAAAVALLILRTLLDVLRSLPREWQDVIAERRGPQLRGIEAHEDVMEIDLTHTRRGGRMDTLMQDIRWAVRSLARRPGFAAIAIMTLALGIGANTALFSVVRTVLLRPLPYRDPSQVAMIWSKWKGFDKTWVSESEFHNYRASLRGFEDIALFSRFETNLTEGEQPERVQASSVMPNLFGVLGVSPALGRAFREEEAQGTAASVVILSHELWQQRYQGDPAVVGRTLNVNGTASEIIGVMPAGFHLPLDFKTDRPTRLWFPYALTVQPGPVTQGGGSHGSYAIGRLRAGVTEAAARAELGTMVAGLRRDNVYPPDWNFEALLIMAADEVSGSIRPALMVLLGAVAFVLLIACVNVANLLLVRGEDRKQEMGVRTALGANRPRLLRLLFAETLVLAAIGGIMGGAVAWLSIGVLRTVAPADLPRVAEVGIDAGVLGFTAVVSLLTAMLFGMIPAWQVARSDVQSMLREGGRANTAGAARSQLRRVLVTVEVAMAVMLAAGAGLMLRSFWRLADIDPGFNASNVLTLRLSTPAAFYPDDPAVVGFYSELLRQVRAQPGVEQAGLIRLLPIDQVIGDSCLQVEGYTPPPGECAPADWQAASDGYFEALGIRVTQGRGIEAGDGPDAPQVIVVNQALVDAYIADGNALGKRVTFGFLGPNTPPQTVVGVVANAQHNDMTTRVKPTFYRPHAQWAKSTGFPQRSMSLVVRTRQDPLTLAGPIRSIVRSLDPRLPISSVQSMDDVLSRAVAQPRFTLALLLAFGGLALTLAIVGIYGVVSYTVAARKQELGIRMALGAAPRTVVWLALRNGLVFAAAGVGIGTLAGLGFTRFMRNLVYETPTTDPLTFAAVAAIGLLAAFVASWLPALRAARTDPLIALRND